MSKRGKEDRHILLRYKGNRCAHCRKSVKGQLRRWGDVGRLFEFHHADPTTKADNYDNLIRRVLSDDVLDEVDKCVLLCRMCHGIAEAQNIKAKLRLTIDLGKLHDYRRTQELKGFMVRDNRTKKVKFFTVERVTIAPYILEVKDKPAQVVSLGELDGEMADSLLASVVTNGGFVVRTIGGRVVLSLELSADKKTVHLMQLFEFDLLKMEDLKTDDGKRVFIRNGMAIVRPSKSKKGGKVHVGGSFTAECEADQFAKIRPAR